jgi:hypothetical protein
MIGPTPVMVGVMMPGGWHYSENGKPIIEDAESYLDLVNKLAEYRGFCGLPLGNPQQDIDNYICNTYPNMCGRQPALEEEGVDKVELSYGVPVQKSPRERVMQWAANRMQNVGQIEFVDSDEADRRAAICNVCPKKIQWNAPIEGCPGCQAYVEEAEAKLIKISANKCTACAVDLHGYSCAVAGHDLETACHLEEPALRHRKNYTGKFPEKCWLKDLYETTPTL